MKRKLFLLYGGKSAEHQVSIRTAFAVMQALDFDKYEVTPVYITEEGQWVKREALENPVKQLNDLIVKPTKEEQNSLTLFNNSAIISNDEPPVIFPLLHGTNGEDGTVQGLLEVLNLPYVGNGVLASSAGMDKVIMKNIFAQAGLKQVDYVSALRHEWEQDKEKVYRRVEESLTYPCFVKPANLGSSVGINKCNDRTELEDAFVEAFQFDRKIIIEQGIEAREIEIGVLGNDEPQCSVVGEIVPKAEFYDYKAKYEDGNTALIIPADIPEETYETIKEMAIQAFKALDCSGLVRADFFVTKDGEVYINEVNTMPGFTPVSMFPLLWKHSGLEYSQLIDRLVELGLERYNEKQKLRYTLD
ncbi:D-alanine--D-alanine ligase [Pallidibacillus pasinlerensis]|uniref:D-alanine--D-alanine ligase n=1 Tax=Pallidibacillus pasinlerensis TaxID=2703818 RepID=A0ABX0A284_9BACI|nr:D-alanine--D-alanine ligase [Pallidibacillus pasinlerensis]NCU17538.1 D-alanine--D-alanine ligase [Pallidibacillus pasinlerensis]